MSYQACPICNGSGTVFSPLSSTTSAICTVCNGKKIIDTVTGLPPTYTAAVNTDFKDANMESQQEYFGK
ncbi:MAG TPA: hypothetical protein PLD02_14645 [Saprospiraceae bacterium]|nr:hypothetical protein [Saprospiraceae bacterium]